MFTPATHKRGTVGISFVRILLSNRNANAFVIIKQLVIFNFTDDVETNEVPV